MNQSENHVVLSVRPCNFMPLYQLAGQLKIYRQTKRREQFDTYKIFTINCRIM
jgi:hypothetical protein